MCLSCKSLSCKSLSCKYLSCKYLSCKSLSRFLCRFSFCNPQPLPPLPVFLLIFKVRQIRPHMQVTVIRIPAQIFLLRQTVLGDVNLCQHLNSLAAFAANHTWITSRSKPRRIGDTSFPPHFSGTPIQPPLMAISS